MCVHGSNKGGVKVFIIPHRVGCLYGTITGYSPRHLQGQDPFLAVLHNDGVPVDDRTPAIPQPLATVIDRALIDNPEIYYKSAAKFNKPYSIVYRKLWFDYQEVFRNPLSSRNRVFWYSQSAITDNTYSP